jgi:hypothetical protein
MEEMERCYSFVLFRRPHGKILVNVKILVIKVENQL